MGQSATAKVGYGFILGGDEGGWELEGAGEYGSLDDAPWDAADAAGGVTEWVEKTLLASVGFTETDWGVEGYFKRRTEALNSVPVTVEIFGTYEFPVYALVVKASLQSADWGVEIIQQPTSDIGYDALLQEVLATLGITPTQEKPAWLLGPVYG